MLKGRKVSFYVILLMLVAFIVSACSGGAKQAPATGSSAPAPAPAPAPVAPEKTKVVLAVGGGECLCYLPTTLAYQMGYFKEEGLEIDMQDMKGGSKALEALIGGSADVVSGYYEHTIRMQTKDKHIAAFVNFNRYPGLVLAVSKQAEGKIKSVKDLKGANVGVSAAGSATHAFVNYLLVKEGLKPTDVAVINVGLGATAVAAMEKGSVDAAVLLDPAASLLQSRGSMKILVDTRTEADTQKVFGKSGYAAGGLYASREFIQKYPVTTQRLTNAILKSLKFINTHSAEEIAAKMPEAYYAGDKNLYISALKAAMPGYSRDGLMQEGAPQNMLEILAISDEGVRNAKDKVKLENTYTNEFAKKAAQK